MNLLAIILHIRFKDVVDILILTVFAYHLYLWFYGTKAFKALVKGGDWEISTIVGRDIVEAQGGKVYSLPFVDEYSTTSIVEEIIRRYA